MKTLPGTSPPRRSGIRTRGAPALWVPQEEVEARLNAKGWDRPWLLGWRDIARATDKRTLISAAIPRYGVGDKFLLMFPSGSVLQSGCLLAILNSLTADYVARQKVGGTAFKFFTMRQIAIPTPSQVNASIAVDLGRRVLALVGPGEGRSFAFSLELATELGLRPPCRNP